MIEPETRFDWFDLLRAIGDVITIVAIISFPVALIIRGAMWLFS